MTVNRHGDSDHAQTAELHSTAVFIVDWCRPVCRSARLVRPPAHSSPVNHLSVTCQSFVNHHYIHAQTTELHFTAVFTVDWCRPVCWSARLVRPPTHSSPVNHLSVISLWNRTPSICGSWLLQVKTCAIVCSRIWKFSFESGFQKPNFKRELWDVS